MHLYDQDRSIREKLYRAYIRRASEGEQNNEENIVKVGALHTTWRCSGGCAST
jgi:Zn-dependent oligopeptidase